MMTWKTTSRSKKLKRKQMLQERLLLVHSPLLRKSRKIELAIRRQGLKSTSRRASGPHLEAVQIIQDPIERGILSVHLLPMCMTCERCLAE